MRQIIDLHIHSRYSRACSPRLDLLAIDKTCRLKGIDIIASGDFTYPEWFSGLKEQLEEISPDNGLYQIKGSDGQVKFILSTEVALIYKEDQRVRRLHLMIQAPNLSAVSELNKYLDKHYNIRSDGRPILGLKAPELVKLCLKIHPQFLIYPAHIWTPWFSVFGSKSGFDSLEECFQDQASNIYAYETGLSSDPSMNWRLSALDNLTCLSNSDAHSLDNLGREANIFNLNKISYQEIYQVIKNQDKKSLQGTIEFYPEEGMYHLDGHRDCNFSCQPTESLKLNNICPVCQKPLTIGVLHRIEELADRPVDFILDNVPPFYRLIELDKIIASALGIKSRQSKAAKQYYRFLIESFGPELTILMDLDLNKMTADVQPKIVEALRRMRQGNLEIKAGFDGRYGEINIFSSQEAANL